MSNNQSGEHFPKQHMGGSKYPFGKGAQVLGDFGVGGAVKGVADAFKSKAKQDRDATVGAHMMGLEKRLDLESKVLDRTHAANTFLRVDKQLGKRNPEGMYHNYTDTFGSVTRHQINKPGEEEGASTPGEGTPESSPVENNLNKVQFPQGSTALPFQQPTEGGAPASKPNFLPVFQEPNVNQAVPAAVPSLSPAQKGIRTRHVNAYAAAHKAFYGSGFTAKNNPTGHATLHALHAKAKAAFGDDTTGFANATSAYPL